MTNDPYPTTKESVPNIDYKQLYEDKAYEASKLEDELKDAKIGLNNYKNKALEKELLVKTYREILDEVLDKIVNK